MAGFGRQVANAKQNGHMSITEGKQPISMSGYKMLADLLIKVPMMLFAWPFFLLCWTLMARSNSVGNIMLQHISWKEDALIVGMAQHKGDKEGQNAFGRHVYANPLNPTICPVLALAVLVFSKDYRDPNSRLQLFEGEKSEGRFSDILGKVVHKF